MTLGVLSFLDYFGYFIGEELCEEKRGGRGARHSVSL